MANTTTVGSLTLYSTINCISVYSPFTGDDNADNSTVLEYKKSVDVAWITAHPLVVDRRTQLVGIQLGASATATTITNPWGSQYRGSIVGLDAGISYDVRVTYTDADGIVGTNPATGSISTLSETIPLGNGTVYYIDPNGSNGNSGTLASPWATLTYALSQVTTATGATIYCRGGTYREAVTVNKSGSMAAGYLTILPYGSEQVTFDGSYSGSFAWSLYETTGAGKNIYRALYGNSFQVLSYYRVSDGKWVKLFEYGALSSLEANSYGVSGAFVRTGGYIYINMPDNDSPASYTVKVSYLGNYGFSIQGNYVHIKNITVNHYQYSAVYCYGTYHHIVIDGVNTGTRNFTFQGTTGSSDGTPAGPYNITIRNCTIEERTTFQSLWYSLAPGYNTFIKLKDTGGHFIIYNNTITGNGLFMDGIGGEDNDDIFDGPHRDTDIYNNTISNCWDDAMELEGGQMNLRYWGNTINQTYGRMGVGHAAISLGPVYGFRNIFNQVRDSTWKTGGGNSYSPSMGYVFLYHNTIYHTYDAAHPSYGCGICGFGNTQYFQNWTVKNNIFHVEKRWTERIQDPSYYTFDYNNVYSEYPSAGPTKFLTIWNTITYTVYATFKTATGKETHGLNAQSDFIDAANGNFRLLDTADEIDAGVVIANFNDADSYWPYSGVGPDIGAYEYDSHTLNPTGIASAEAFGTPTVTGGAITVTATGIASAEAFGTPSVVVAGVAQTIDLDTPNLAIASAEAFGTPSVSQPRTITMTCTTSQALHIAITFSGGGVSPSEKRTNLTNYNVGETVICNASITDSTGAATDPATSILAIITQESPGHSVKIDSEDMTKSGTGEYYYDFDSEDMPPGDYTFACKAIDGTRVSIEKASFKLID